MILNDGTKQIELVILRDDCIPYDKNKNVFIGKLRGSVFEDYAEEIHKWLLNIKCAPNPDIKQPSLDFMHMYEEDYKIAKSLLALKCEDEIKVGNAQATLPNDVKKHLEEYLEKLYKEHGLDTPAIINNDKDKFLDSLTHEERMNYLSEMLSKQTDEQVETSINLFFRKVEVTKKQIKDKIKELEHTIKSLSNSKGRPKSNTKLYCAIDVFLNHKSNKKLSNSDYRVIYKCLDYMDLIPLNIKERIARKENELYSYAIENYIKSLCIETKKYEIGYLRIPPPGMSYEEFVNLNQK